MAKPLASPFGTKSRSWIEGSPLRSHDFPLGTPLNHFFAWNETARYPDRRYLIACDLHRLITAFGGGDVAFEVAASHLSLQPIIIARRASKLLICKRTAWDADCGEAEASGSAKRAARLTVRALVDSIGSGDIETHAALFAAFEQLADQIDLAALAKRRPRLVPSRQRTSSRRILVLRLSALGDFVQALGPAAAIRRHHRHDHISLLTTASFAEFAEQLGFFDRVIIDRRPRAFDIAGWLGLSRRLRSCRFDRVYDLQTSQRSAVYARLFRPGAMPEWSGIVHGCTHPHANLDRDRQHTIDKQAEQLLMAGIYPTPLPSLPPLGAELPRSLAGRRFVLLVPGASPRHPAKRWPARSYGSLASALHRQNFVPAIIGSEPEKQVGAAICENCPGAIDLVGRTDLAAVGALAERASLAIGNDTGIMHLAAAAGCPLVVLFSRASDFTWCAPRGRAVRVIAVADLTTLEVDRVVSEAIAILHGPAFGAENKQALNPACDMIPGGAPS